VLFYFLLKKDLNQNFADFSSMSEEKRKGARSVKDIPAAILRQLNSGVIETANLVEWLAVDQRRLLHHLLKESNRLSYLLPIVETIDQLKKQTVNTINEVIGNGILEQCQKKGDHDFLLMVASHKADVVRCWATYTIGHNTALPIDDALKLIQAFAADKHFGVREISWMAMRHKITGNLKKSLLILSQWAAHEDENIRRFATESTRPRGVWCEHISILKEQPELALSILDQLKADPSRYVQDSVGNWLNDASKSKPDFVKQLCQRWEKESPGKATAYIIKKALRTINK